ncbi:uncharacterized protein JCM6883_004614 [Sporobolomyces salmoneus]|uniref:uncharacterized protein n=1 Tax=Sporobolomyces salmoneus TaxID=183962 RepID=UPI0031708262
MGLAQVSNHSREAFYVSAICKDFIHKIDKINEQTDRSIEIVFDELAAALLWNLSVIDAVQDRKCKEKLWKQIQDVFSLSQGNEVRVKAFVYNDVGSKEGFLEVLYGVSHPNPNRPLLGAITPYNNVNCLVRFPPSEPSVSHITKLTWDDGRSREPSIFDVGNPAQLLADALSDLETACGRDASRIDWATHNAKLDTIILLQPLLEAVLGRGSKLLPLNREDFDVLTRTHFQKEFKKAIEDAGIENLERLSSWIKRVRIYMKQRLDDLKQNLKLVSDVPLPAQEAQKRLEMRLSAFIYFRKLLREIYPHISHSLSSNPHLTPRKLQVYPDLALDSM